MKLTSSPREELLDHQPSLKRSQRGFRLGAVVSDHHAFAGSQAVGFEDHREAEAVEIGSGVDRVVHDDVLRRGDIPLHEKVLCEDFAAFELRGAAIGPDDLSAACPERIHHSRNQGSLRPDHREIRLNVFRQREQSFRGAVSQRAGRFRSSQCPDCPAPRRPHDRETGPVSTPARVRGRLRQEPIFSFDTMISMQEKYDVVVVGAGHAGCEAARACARMGLKTAIVTMNLDLIAQMSCNPAIGGIAKGHLVREIDALGGAMGEVADAVGIQFRLLNTSRGPAVWSPRAQMDKRVYRVRMREVLEQEPNLRIKQAEVAALEIADRRVTGVLLARWPDASKPARWWSPRERF